MKKIALLAGIPLFLAFAFSALATPFTSPSGPATFNVTASAQDLSYTLVSSKTNHSSTSTNITQVLKSSVTNFVVNSDYMLSLLANSFNTNYPSDAKLVMVGSQTYSIYVMDKTGTNIIQNVSSVLISGIDIWVFNAGSETLVTTMTGSTTTVSGNDTETYTEHAVLNYDDTSLTTTTDGTHTKFSLEGTLTEKLSRNIATSQATESVSMSGNGGGTIRGKNVLLKGTVTGKLSGRFLLD